MNIVLVLHSIVRYLILLAAIIGLIKAIITFAQKGRGDRIDAILASIFLGLFDLQAALGVLIIFLGGLLGPLHPLLMFIALLIAHWLSAMVKRAEGAKANPLRFAFYAAPLAIVIFGLAILGQLRV